MNFKNLHKDKWLKVKFGDIAKSITTKANPKKTIYDYYIGLEHLDYGVLKVSRFDSVDKIKGDKYLLKKGQIIFAKRNAYLKRVAIAPFDCLVSAHSMVIEPISNSISAEFLPHLMQTEFFWNIAIMISEGSISPTIKWKTLAEQPFYCPKKEIQPQLVTLFKKIDTTIEQTRIHKEKLEAFKKGLLNELIG